MYFWHVCFNSIIVSCSRHIVSKIALSIMASKIDQVIQKWCTILKSRSVLNPLPIYVWLFKVICCLTLSLKGKLKAFGALRSLWKAAPKEMYISFQFEVDKICMMLNVLKLFYSIFYHTKSVLPFHFSIRVCCAGLSRWQFVLMDE